MPDKPTLEASHPFHKAIKGQQGGSLPKVHNNHLNSCSAKMEACRAAVQAKLGHLKPPKVVR